MLRWFVIGAVLGPVLLVVTGFFVSNPGVLWWVAGVAAAVFAGGIAVVVHDDARFRRDHAARAKVAFDEAMLRRQAPEQE